MPLELYAIGSSGLALVAVVLMVVTRTAPISGERWMQTRAKGKDGASKPR